MKSPFNPYIMSAIFKERVFSWFSVFHVHLKEVYMHGIDIERRQMISKKSLVLHNTVQNEYDSFVFKTQV